jgi:hypothetical protein
MKSHIRALFKNKSQTLLLLQIPCFLLILVFVPTNIGKLFFFVILWALTFTKLTKKEWIFVTFVCFLFTGLNIPAVAHEIFAFSKPDLFGLPVYEFFTWGFYLLHAKRLLGGPTPKGNWWLVLLLVILFSLCFVLVSDTAILLVMSFIVLGVSILFYHEPMDFLYIGYFLLMGTLIEYTGVLSGEWHYFNSPLGGVPFWYITLWGGTGLFLRRLILPFFVKGKNKLQKA